MAKNTKLEKEVEHLEVKLKIPRHHFKYLEEHGTLNEFVKAKNNGNDDGARTALDRAMERGEKMRYTVDSIHQSMSQASPRGHFKLQKRRSLMLTTELGFKSHRPEKTMYSS